MFRRFREPPPGDQWYGDTRDTLLLVEKDEYLAYSDYATVAIAVVVEHDNRTSDEICVLEAAALQPETIPPEPAPASQAAGAISTTLVGSVAMLGAADALRRVAARRMAAGAGRGRP